MAFEINSISSFELDDDEDIPEIDYRDQAAKRRRLREQGLAKRWTPRLVERGWTGVSNYFLENYSRLGPPGGEGLNSTQAIVVIQIMSLQYGNSKSKVSLTQISKRMGLDVRTIRTAVKTLQDLKLLYRTYSKGAPSSYNFNPLFKRLEELMDQDIETQDEQEEEA